MIVKKYTPDSKQVWNSLIDDSKQGTFLLNRNFMDYHSDRFVDNSLMFYNNKNELVAILPANIKDNILYSHQGLTYGGLIYKRDLKTSEVLSCFAALKSYAEEFLIKKLIYKKIPYIYADYLADEDLYALFVSGAKLVRRDIAYAILMEDPIKISRSKTRYLKNFTGYKIVQTDRYDDFYLVLKEALTLHNATPVHSAAELKLLTERFPDNIKLYGIFNQDEDMVAGTWLFITKTSIHVQYMMAVKSAREGNVIDYAYNYIIENLTHGKKYLSFGISTEQDGRYLNMGLSWQKESFGGRGVCHDFYELEFNF